MAKVNAFGKILSFPDDATTEEIEGFLNSNAHLLDPEYKQPEGLSGLAKNVFTGAKQTGRMVGATVDAARNNLSGVEEYAKESQVSAQRNMPVEQRKLIGELSEINRDQGALSQIGDTLKAAGRNPMGTGQLVAEQLPNTAVSLGGGYAGFKTGAAAGALLGPVGATIGGAIGFVGGMFLGNVLLEAGGKAIEKASDADGFTPQDRDESLREGAVKGAVITGIDAATFKIGGLISKKLGSAAINAGAKAEAKVLIDAGVDATSLTAINAALKNSPELFRTARVAGENAALQSLSTGRKAGIIGTGMALETASEGIGEYAGEYAATGKGDVVDATIEALSSATMSIAETAYNYNKVAAGNDLSPEGIQKVAGQVNEFETKSGIDEISKAATVDDAIKAANKVASRKPETKDSILTSIDPTLADIERLTGLKPSESIEAALNESQQGLNAGSISPQADAKNILSAANVEGQISQPLEGIINEEKIDQKPARNPPETRQKSTTPTKSSGVLGNDTEIVLPDGATLPAKWDVIDADSVTASIKEGVNQPRDRTRAASDIQIQGIANNPDYRRLSDSPVMDVGAPVISNDDLIVAGNGRYEGISRAHDIGRAGSYLENLKRDAVNKGIDPAIIESMKKPVLVRRITQPFDTRKLAIASNSGSGLQYSGLELAKIDAERMSGIEDLDITDTGDIALTASNFSKLKQTLGDYNPTELAAFTDDSGGLSQDGVRRVRNAMLAKAYGKSDTLGRLVESTDSDMRNVLGALTKSASSVAKAKKNIASGAAPKGIDVTENLLEAVETFSQIRSKGQPLDNYLAQQSLFGDGIDADSKAILQYLYDNVRSQKRLAEFIKSVYDQISTTDQTTENIFGEESAPVKRELIENAKQREQQQPDIFQTGADNKAGQANEQQSNAKTDNVGSGKSKQEPGLKFSRSPEERLKDRERAKQLEKKLKDQGYNFTITARDVRDFAAMDRGRQNEAIAAEQIARIFRKRIVWINAFGDFKINGVMIPSIKDTIFIDVTTEKYAHAVMGHELSHHMDHDAPAVYRDLVKSLEGVIKNHDEYAKKYDIKGADRDYLTKEIVGDIMGDNFTDPAFWDKVANYNPNTFRKIADAVITWLKRIIENAKMRSLGSEQWVTDAQKARDIVAKAVAQYTSNTSSISKEKPSSVLSGNQPSTEGDSQARSEISVDDVPQEWENDKDVMELYHGGDDRIVALDGRGYYRSIFASNDYSAASSHGDVVTKFYVPKDKIIKGDLDWDHGYEKTAQSLSESLNDHPLALRYLDFDDIYDIVVYENEEIIDEKDLREDYDLMFELQALRADVADKLGYYAVSVKDEHGVSYQIVNSLNIPKHDSTAKFSKLNQTQKNILSDNQVEGETPVRSDNLEIPKETGFRKIQREWQDDFNRFTVIKDWLKSRGVTLSEKADVSLAEERFHARVANQKEDFRDFVVNPLIERIAKAGFKMTDIADYLEAQHAKEANAQIRKLQDTTDPEVTAYGISDEDAEAYLDSAPDELGKLANEFRAITEQTKRLRLDSGLLNTDITDAWEATYRHYIPVKGLQEQPKGTGKGLSVNFKTKRRLGHGRRDEAVIENILHDHERAIFEVEKNRVAKHLAMMAAEIGIPELMTIGQPVKRKVLRNTTAYEVQVKGVTTAVFDTREAAQTYKSTLPLIDKKIASDEVVINPTTDQRIVATASPMLADNEINVYIDGHAIRIQINDELAARAYKKLGIDGYGKLVAAGRALNGYLSKVYTGYNPEFIMVNLVRDFTTGVINLTGEEGLMMAAKAIKNYPSTFASLLKYAISNRKNSNKWIDMYRATGGNTGAAYLSDMERLGDDVATEYAAYQGVLANLKEGKPVFAARAAGRKAFNVFLKWIYNMNQAGENAMRLAAFKAMIESGKTKNEAAHVAKNITVNFNRKGENGATANAAWLFFNASVQGQAAMFHALFKGKRKGQAWALATGMATLGYLAAAAMGGGDEDDYDKVDDYTKERNLLIKNGDGWLKIPVPYGHGFFYNIGRAMADAQRKDELGLLPWHILSSAIEELTPFGDVVVGSDEQFKMDQVFMGIMPTALKIPGQIATNKQTFSGGEIMPESPFDKSQPDREKMWRGTKGTIYDELAGHLQMIGMDVSPETLKYSFRTGTGGAGALVDTTISAGMLKSGGAELEPNEIPFLRKIYQENTIKNDRAAFYIARKEAQTASEELARAIKRSDFLTAKKLAEDKGEMIALDKYADKLQKVTKVWRDEQDRVRLDKNMSAGEKRLKLKELEAQESKLYDEYLEIFKVKKSEVKRKTNDN